MVLDACQAKISRASDIREIDRRILYRRLKQPE
jgi:transcriptional regulator of acetoin/glycerol metabolism